MYIYEIVMESLFVGCELNKKGILRCFGMILIHFY